MKVLVTGSRGYIGCVLVPMLQKEGHEVVGLDTDLYARCTFTGEVPDVPTILKDVRDVEIEDLEGFNAIIHLAGLSNDPLGDFNASLTVDINELGSIHIAKLAKKVGVERFLFASSCSNYGASGSNFLDEDSAFNPVTPYGSSKVAVEKALMKLADEKFHPTYLRASTAYGMSPRIRFDLVANNLTAWAYTTGEVYLKSDGTPWRPIVHVEDISRAYIAVLHAPLEEVHNNSYNVGTTTENYTIKEIAEIVKDIVPGCKVSFAPSAGPDKRCYRVNCDKIARNLHGFKPQWTARRGVEQLYEVYKDSNITLEDFEGPKYKRIAHIQELIAENKLGEDFRWVKQTAEAKGV